MNTNDNEELDNQNEENDEDLSGECDYCGAIIPEGNPYVLIMKNIESIEYSILNNRVEATVVDSQELITYCKTCGNRFDMETAMKLLRTIPLLGDETKN